MADALVQRRDRVAPAPGRPWLRVQEPDPASSTGDGAKDIASGVPIVRARIAADDHRGPRADFHAVAGPEALEGAPVVAPPPPEGSAGTRQQTERVDAVPAPGQQSGDFLDVVHEHERPDTGELLVHDIDEI